MVVAPFRLRDASGAAAPRLPEHRPPVRSSGQSTSRRTTPDSPVPRSRLPRPLARAALVAVALASLLTGPAAALEPSRPLPGYRPDFVTERQPGRWKDCLWASGAMLIDKWTNGQTTVGREHLRRLSGDLHGGSTLADLSRAFARFDLDLRYSPDGGDAVTWSALLKRLATGGGAVLLGDQHRMPRYFGRWDRKFWAKTGKGDDHAVYVERYNPRTGLVWLMDPLAPAAWPGEWVRAATLRRFVWTRGGAVVVAMTPPAKPAPFAGVKLGDDGASATAGALRVAWPVAAADGWTFQGADVKSVTTRIAAADVLVGSKTVALPAGDDEQVAGRPGVSVENGALIATVAVPDAPGVYRIRTTITDRRFGHVVAKSRITVYVPGPRAAMVTSTSPAAIVDPEAEAAPVVTGQQVPMTLEAYNIGVLTWADPDPGPAMPAGARTSLGTHLTGTWVPVALEVAAAGGTMTPVVDLGAAPLSPGSSLWFTASLEAPGSAGRWAFVIEVSDSIDGAFSKSGSAPAILFFDVVPALPADPRTQ